MSSIALHLGMLLWCSLNLYCVDLESEIQAYGRVAAGCVCAAVPLSQFLLLFPA